MPTNAIFINLPDVIPSMPMNIVNHSSALFIANAGSTTQSPVNIPNVTGQSMYSARANNPRLGRMEYIVPIYFYTAINLMNAQQQALADGRTLIMYEAFRPAATQTRVADNLGALAAANSQVQASFGGVAMSWFISTGISNHQRGVAVDVSLGNVNSMGQISVGTYTVPVVQAFQSLTSTMPTPMHELSIRAAVRTVQGTGFSSTFTPGLAAGTNARILHDLMIGNSFTELPSEWWHFNGFANINSQGNNLFPGTWGANLTNHSRIPTNNNGGTPTSSPTNSPINSPTNPINGALPTDCDGADNPNRGPFTTNANGEVTPEMIGPLAPGTWRVTETVPPTGYLLSAPNFQDVTIAAGQTGEVTVAFMNQPTTTPPNTPTPPPNGPPPNGPGNGVRIVKVCAIHREMVPGALMRLRGMTAQDITVIDATGNVRNLTLNNTGINVSQVLTAGASVAPAGGATSTVGNGWWEINGLPYGFYMVEEERAPDGFSILPQHTAFGFWKLPPGYTIHNVPPPHEVIFVHPNPGTSHIQVVFENYPLSEIVVYKHAWANGEGGQPLAGAHFRIQGSGIGNLNNPGEIIDRIGISDASGRVVFSGLPAGTFTITEVMAPPGWLISPPRNTSHSNVQTVTVGWGQRVETCICGGSPADGGNAPVIRFYNEEKSALEVLKIDGMTGEPLAGAIFEIYDPTTGEQWQATSGPNGIAILGREGGNNFLYPDRTLIVREIQPPPGFVLSGERREVVLSPGMNRITWHNYENPGLTIRKICQDTNVGLEGAHFTVVAQGSGSQMSFDFPLITDANGEIFIPAILFAQQAEGERVFIVTETVPPPGFHLTDPNWQSVTMMAGHHHTVVFANRRMPTLTIHKTDARTGWDIEGAEFTIYRLTSPNSGYLTGNPFRTDANGRIILPDLPAGRYRIVETRAARNYWLDPLEQNRSWIIEIRPNEDYLLQISNIMLPSLIITKWNVLTHRPVPLTHFRIEREVPNSPHLEFIGNFVTDRNGQIILPFMPVGWYRVTEIRPAPGMALNTNNSYRVYLNPGDNTYNILHILFPNMAQNDFNTVHQPETSPEPNVPPPPPPTNPWRTYDDSELQLPQSVPNVPGFAYTPAQWEAMSLAARQQAVSSGVQVTGGDAHHLGYGVWNWPLNSIIIKKTCSVTGNLLPGATFELIHISAGVSGTLGTVIGRYTTNHSGIIVVTGLEPGTYAVREVQAPNNFTLSVNNTQHAWLQPDGHSIVELEFSNNPFSSLLITKRCEISGLPLQNAEFRVTTSDGTAVGAANGVFRTNAQGEILIPNLRPDSFLVTEVQAPPGFQLERITQSIRINADGQIYRLDFTNRPYSTLIIRKIDSFDGTPLPGATFEVREADGTYVGTFITDANGQIEIPNVLGWFRITETAPPPGFALDDTPLRVVQVRPHAPTVVTFLNPRLGSLTVQKVDQFGAPLSGAVFRISHQNGQLVGEHTTNAAGIIHLPDLSAGFYFVEEIRAPQGFVLSSAGRTVEVRTNTAQVVTFENLPYPIITIVKVDEAGHPLPGARFRVRQIGGAFEQEVTTGTGGIASLNVPVGTFEVIEIQAPPGFVLTEAARNVNMVAGQNTVLNFVNLREPSLVIEKVDIYGNPLQGAEFEVRRVDGYLIHRGTTDNGGIITVTGLAPGVLTITETRAPQGFAITEGARTVTIVAGQTVTERFVNHRLALFTIQKLDGGTDQPQQGVIFEIASLSGERIRNPVNNSFEFITDAAGFIRLPNLPVGSYVATETRPLPGFRAAAPITFTVSHDTAYIFTIRNYRYADINIRKLSGETLQPMAGVHFEIAPFFANGSAGERVRNPHDNSFIWITDAAGLIRIPHLPPGTYVATEIRTHDGYMLADPVVFTVVENQDTTITIYNYRYPEWVIRKICGETGNPLQGVVFEVAPLFTGGQQGNRLQNAHGGFEFVTDAAGIIRLGHLTPGAYIITETRPLPGFITAEPVTIIVEPGSTNSEIIIRNYRLPVYVIRKISGDDGRPLAGVVFEVAHYFGNGNQGNRIRNPINGSNEFVTDAAGLIHLPQLAHGTYVLIETRPLPGYMNAEPRVFVVDDNADRTIIVRNYKYATYVIRKISGDDGRPLAGVVFEIAHYFGNGNAGERLRNPANGSNEWITDHAGLIYLAALPPGTYVAIETRPLPGYQNAEPRVFVVGDNQDRTIIIRNYKYATYVIRKIDGETGNPLPGVTFEIAHYFGNGNAGQRLINPANGSIEWVTDQAGLIYLAALPPGTYVAIETRALPGYVLADPVVFVVGDNQDRTIIIRNYRMGALTVRKINSVTRQPLEGVVFQFSRPDGQRIRNPQTGLFDFVSDRAGLVHLPALDDGVLFITETRSLPGFIGLTDPLMVEINAAARYREYLVVIENQPMAGLRITKVDSVTQQPIQGVEFRIFDFITNQEVAGPFITDNNGRIDFAGILVPGRYTIRETRQAPGYILDNMPRTIELRAGMMTEIIWENTREAGQIQITKMSSADSQITALPARTRLEGAVFEVRDWRTGNVVDQFVTGPNGVGASRPLPLGRYTVHEIISPPFFQRSDVVLDVTIEFSGQILRYNFYNEPANVGVEVRKTGPIEVMPGQPIIWEITTIANSSNVPLSDFYVRDILPAHAVQLDRIFTGTFNQELRYSIMFRTNLSDTWRVAYDNLSSTVNNALHMSPAALGLRTGEHVTEFMFQFGTVRAGFRLVERGRIEGTVRDNVTNGMQLANRMDIGGRMGTEWIIGNHVWMTRVFVPTRPGQHPRTGW